MRKHWFTACALAGMTAGCTSPNGNGNGNGNGDGYGGWFASTPTSGGGQQVAQAQQGGVQRQMQPIGHQAANNDRWYDPITSPFRTESTSPELYISMAEMSLRGGNVQHARSLYQKAITQDPTNVAALMGAARMEDREGQLDVALSLYDRAAKAQPNNPTALNDLALCLARRGDMPAAERVLSQAINLQPQNPLYRNNIAKILVEMNRTDHAMAQLSAVYPPAVVQYNAAVLLAERGRTQEAMQHASAALAIDPRMDQARALLSQLAPTMPMQTGPVMQVAAPMTLQTNDSILPTPGGPPALVAPGSGSTLPVTQAPTLLPPVN